MKKLLRNIAILLLPILAYYGLFLAFEPNNYFGLRSETPSGAIFGELREYQQNPTPSILIGDSRFANIEDMEAFSAAVGRPFSNLSFRGSSLQENLDELEYLLERYPEIDEVVFELSFYTVNQNYAADRFDFIEKAMTNPFAYLANLSYNLEAMQNLVLWARGETLGGGAAETRNPAQDVYTEWENPATGEVVTIREDILSYLNIIRAEYLNDWAVDLSEEGQSQRLLEIIQSCEEKGIRFVVVFPPIHDATFTYGVVETGILEEMTPLLEDLKESPALVLDYELTNRPAYGEDLWFDGLHLDYERGLPVWIEQLCGDIR